MSLDERTLQRLRVPLGFIFAAVFFIFAKPTAMTLAIGGMIALLGIVIRAWASGHIRKAKTLAVTGPYAHTRNPLYVGSFVVGVGFTAASGIWWLAIIFIALFLGIYLPVMRVEARDMERLFAQEFKEYEQHVPLFVPRLTAWKKSEGKFDYRLYLQYREYRAAMGALTAIALLAAKSYFFD